METKSKLKKLEKSPAKKKIIASDGSNLNLYNSEGKQNGTTELDKKWDKVVINPKTLAQYVHIYLTNQRQGTVSAKTRGDIIGSTKKIYKQKGTGRARHGSRKAPIFVGGGVVGGPKPRIFSSRFNKQQLTITIQAALATKLKNKEVIILEDSALKMPLKTKSYAQMFCQINPKRQECLLLLTEDIKNVRQACNNIPYIKMEILRNLNPYIILRYKLIIMTVSMLMELSKQIK